MPSPFDNLCGPGKPLKAEPPDAKEFAGLKRSGHARLQDALNTSLSLEGRFDLAYNAAHALCLAALRWNGYRSSSCSLTRWASARRSGESCRSVTTSATWVSTKAT
jgi:hypothetical protein